MRFWCSYNPPAKYRFMSKKKKFVIESTLVFVNLQYVSNDRMENIRPVLVQESDTPEETQANGTNISANQGNVEYFEPETEINVSSELED